MQKNEFLAIFQNVLQTNDAFPIKFEEAWQWIGYSRKDVAKRVLEVNFTQEVDYSTLRRKVERQWVEDISLSNDCFKSLCMLASTETGKRVRQYFLECEKQLQQVQKALTPGELVLQNAQAFVAMERRQAAQESRILQLEAKTTTINEEFYSLAGFYRIKGMRWNLAQVEAIQKGRQAKTLSLEMGYSVGKVYDAKFGEVNTYHARVLEALLCSKKP